MEAYINGALRKELHIAPVIERFEAATLERSYWWISPVLEIIYLNIAFMPMFC